MIVDGDRESVSLSPSDGIAGGLQLCFNWTLPRVSLMSQGIFPYFRCALDGCVPQLCCGSSCCTIAVKG